ncbi:myocardial zonula adherens protein-like [Megalops cyprinoides]|uniref:myocardial zonula adherens protein-like n=1 Tax=Megalops cyprinoides TaxID=118141 RepID=UPI001864A3D1|nr:myocardial zonula adherens protein-like [Megalops cyprinoides]
MQRYGSRATITTTADTQDLNSERRIRRLRLTLHSNDSPGQDGTRGSSADTQVDKAFNSSRRRRNGYIQSERPARVEPPVQHLTNGAGDQSLQTGPKVYGVVQRTGADSQQEVMACQWSVNHLRDEMRYIKEVRESLEKVRERMYGQFGSMQQSVQRLSRDIMSAQAQRRSLEAEVRSRTTGMESFDQMNSSLISANIDLQKSLLESCSDRVQAREELKSLRASYERAEESLREKERQLAAAQTENNTLRQQVESCHEAHSKQLQELTLRLRSQYEERLQEERRKHEEEVEALQAQIADYVRQIEEAEKNAKIAEAKIAERDQRISEVERLLACMGQEKSQLEQKLRDCELRLRRLEQTDHVDAATAKRTQRLEDEAAELRERIKHLNDMVFTQQRKVKGMIEEVETLKEKVAQKDMFITELLDRIAIVECENNELEDKVQYFLSQQKVQGNPVATRDVGVGCDLPQGPEQQPLTAVTAPARVRSSLPVHSRMESSVLKYTPQQYSSLLQSTHTQQSRVVMRSTNCTTVRRTPAQSGPVLSVTEESSLVQSTSVQSNHRARSGPPNLYTPYMKLMEIAANIKTERN